MEKLYCKEHGEAAIELTLKQLKHFPDEYTKIVTGAIQRSDCTCDSCLKPLTKGDIIYYTINLAEKLHEPDNLYKYFDKDSMHTSCYAMEYLDRFAYRDLVGCKMPKNKIDHYIPWEEKTVSVALFSSKSFDDSIQLYNKFNQYRIRTIYTSRTEGAALNAKEYANENRLEFIEHISKDKSQQQRNELIVNEASLVIAFWDGKSTEILKALTYAKVHGKEVDIVWV